MSTSNLFAKLIISGHRFVYPAEYNFINVWGVLSYPHRPTPKEISIYREFIGNADGETKFLILGPTPELRDLISELGSRPGLVDFSWLLLTGMTRFLKKAKPEEEIWMKGDWLDVPLPDSFFDVVLADLSLRHVRPERQRELLAKISRILRPGGKFIARHHIINPKYQRLSYAEILDEFSFSPYEKTKYEAMGVLLSRLYDAGTESEMINPKAITGGVKEYLEKKSIPISYRLFLNEFLLKRLYPQRRRLVSQTKEDIERKVKKYFKISEIKNDDEYPESEFYPIYLLAKND